MGQVYQLLPKGYRRKYGNPDLHPVHLIRSLTSYAFRFGIMWFLLKLRSQPNLYQSHPTYRMILILDSKIHLS